MVRAAHRIHLNVGMLQPVVKLGQRELHSLLQLPFRIYLTRVRVGVVKGMLCQKNWAQPLLQRGRAHRSIPSQLQRVQSPKLLMTLFTLLAYLPRTLQLQKAEYLPLMILLPPRFKVPNLLPLLKINNQHQLLSKQCPTPHTILSHPPLLHPQCIPILERTRG